MESVLSLISRLGGFHIGKDLPAVIQVSGPDMHSESFVCVCVFPNLLQVGPVISEAQIFSGDYLNLLFLLEQNHLQEFSAPGHLQFHVDQIFSQQVVPSETRSRPGTFLVVQWLRLCASTARGMGSIPGHRTKILHATRCSQEGKKTKK